MEQSAAQTTTSMTESDVNTNATSMDNSGSHRRDGNATSDVSSMLLRSRVNEIVTQFNAAKQLWKVSVERDLLRLPQGDVIDVLSTMFRLLQSLSAATAEEQQQGSPGSRKAFRAGAPLATVPTQGDSQFGSPGTNADIANDDSFVGEAVLGKGTETNADASDYTGESTPYDTHLASPLLSGTTKTGLNDGEVIKLTEDALQRFSEKIPGVLVSGLVQPGGDDDSSDDVSDTRMSVSRSDVHDDGIFDGVNDYILLEQIGKGQTGKVFKAMDTKSNQIVAIKIVPRHLIVETRTKPAAAGSLSLAVPSQAEASAAETKFKREVLIMKRLKHRNIARLIEVIDDAEEQQVYLVMPHLDGGPLITFSQERTCEPLPTDVVRRHLTNVIAGLQYLKKHRIVHRDLKPDNIILNKGVAMLVDFGQSEWADGANPVLEPDPLASSGSDAGGPNVRVRNLGTPAFMAPEVIRGEKPDFPSDVWSLGVILYAMLYGRLPFRGAFAGRRGAGATAGAPDLLDQILYAEPELDENEVDFVWNDLISMMLEKNPQERVTLSDIKRHAAMTGGAGSRSVSSAGSELDTSGLTPRDFGELESAVTERRRPNGLTIVQPDEKAAAQADQDASMNMGSCLQSPVQRLPAHQRLARFRLSGVKGGPGLNGATTEPNALVLPLPVMPS